MLRGTARLALMTLAIGAVSAPVSGAESRVVLVLHTYGHDTPSRLQIDTSLAQAFREVSGTTIDLYIETLDPNRFAPSQVALTRDYLRGRYAGKQIAVIVAVYDRALAFLLDPRDPLFPGVPIAAVLSSYPKTIADRVTVLWTGRVVADSLVVALKLHPRARRIALIDAASHLGISDPVRDELVSQAESIAPVPIIRLFDLPLDELIPRVQALPTDTIIMINRQTIGWRGAPTSGVDVIRELTRTAPGPIYTTSDQQVGSGAVGGVVINMYGQATELAQLALRIAATGARHTPPATITLVPTFDWRQLRRWRVREDLLPPHSVVRFREYSLWDRYRWYVVGALTVCVTQSALIAGLLLHRRRRRRAEVALCDSESALSASACRVESLAGRLITAQEVERSRLARDLHDDFSQQLALLSIELNHLVNTAGGAGGGIRHARAAAARAAEIATGVHNLSHELHPARLEFLGLGPALDELCREMSSAHDAAIEFERWPLSRPIPEPAALCLFRVTQEALRNVVKHSGGRTARVILREFDGITQLQVTDPGCGFAPETSANGLGLISMRERVSLIGGAIAVHSRAGAGTRIVVTIPVREDPARTMAS
jgi:signal transduction histidine kinase